MLIQIASDFHADKNEFFLPYLDFGSKNTLTIIAGDVANCREDTEKFLHSHFNNVIFVGGNHILYNDEGKTIQEIHDEYRAAFPIDSKISYLENDVKIIGDYAFVGCTLWGDYTRLPKGITDKEKQKIEKRLKKRKEFTKGYFDDNGNKVKLTPDHLTDMFYESLAFIKTVHDKLSADGKKIVLVTHHAPSPQALSKKHIKKGKRTLYASELEEYIKDELPNLSLIIHGHIHKYREYHIGGIPVVCNPLGDLSWEINSKVLCDPAGNLVANVAYHIKSKCDLKFTMDLDALEELLCPITLRRVNKYSKLVLAA
ncbi:MAG: metallophosphoesterase [Alphaproteobacteria bacterium]|nr:metallophosphoesterase [Alphaproteobacteria bacterium]